MSNNDKVRITSRAGEPGDFGSLELEPEPLEKKNRRLSRSRLEKKVRSRSR